MVTTSLAFPQKAFNVRREPRVALLFSEPTGSGLEEPEQILVRGTAVCPEEIHTAPDGDLGVFWGQMFQRQPKCRGYLDWPATTMTDFYFMRLLITVTPQEVSTRPLPTPGAPGSSDLPGGAVLARYGSVVLAARDESGAPTLVRTTVTTEGAGYRVAVPQDVAVVEGPASLLVHRHDERLWNLHNANVQGVLRADDDGWVLVPGRVVDPNQGTLQTLRACRAATRRYLERRNLARPGIPWGQYKAIRARAPKS
jgi:hypothetical protein